MSPEQLNPMVGSMTGAGVGATSPTKKHGQQVLLIEQCARRPIHCVICLTYVLPGQTLDGVRGSKEAGC